MSRSVVLDKPGTPATFAPTTGLAFAGLAVNGPPGLGSGSHAVTTPGPRFQRWRTSRLIAVLAALLTIGTAFATWDDSRDLLGVIQGFAGGVGSLRWQFGPVLAAMAGAHYVAAAVAVRAASGRRLPLREVTLAQFAAAAANRLTPAGLGGAALNTRYLSRRGLPLPVAVGSIAALHILGPVTDVLLVLALVGIGCIVGTGAGLGHVATLATRTARMPISVWDAGWLARAAVVGTTIGLITWIIRRRAAGGEPTTASIRRLAAPLTRLVREPRRLAVLLAASTATTVILGVAFAVSLAMVPGPAPKVSIVTVVTVYVLGSALGSAVPVPAGVGSTDASLVAALLAVGTPTGHALRVVLLFRAVAFWAPPAYGIVAARTLKRRGAL